MTDPADIKNIVRKIYKKYVKRFYTLSKIEKVTPQNREKLSFLLRKLNSL